jgi:hypothetical protein
MAPGLHRPTHRSTHPPIHYLLRGGRLASLGLIALLVACGGGGGSSGGGGGDPTTYTVTASAGTGGSISPANATVTDGETTSFTVTPNEHYSISGVAGTCGGTLSGSTYTTAPVTADCTVEASFVIDSYTVSTSAGDGGSIDPESATVDHGQTTTFTIIPDDGHGVESVLGCGGSLEPDGATYTTGVITEACTVTASFLPLVGIEDASELEGDSGTTTMSFTVTLGAEANGPVSVDYATSSGTGNGFATGGESCVAGVDYVEVIDTLTISAGSTSTEIAVEVCGDTEFEPNETFTVTLSNVSANALLNVATATGTIVNDDAGGLNDTGITWCADAGDCPVDDYPGQDAEHGRDANPLTNDDTDGHAGFSYTKIGADGTPLIIQNGTWDESGSEELGTKWSCVLDNVTGLMWEIKVDNNASLHHRGWTYTWFNSDNDSNGGAPGTENGGSCLGGTGCDTEKYVVTVNEAALCGFNNWRMPTRNELLSIVHNGRPSLAIDVDYFPNTATAFFWSSVPDARESDRAWLLGSSDGIIARNSKGTPSRVRLVRGGQ